LPWLQRLAALVFWLKRLAALGTTLLAVACAATAPKPTPPGQPAVSIPIAPPRPSSGDARFDAFLMAAKDEAAAQGIRSEVFDQATAGLKPISSIAQMNLNQPEFSKPVWSYLDSAVSARRVADAQAMLARYGDVLARLETQYGVPREILVAIWGMETDYGADSGGFPIFAALATLAYDGPRAAYAKPEFFAALKLYQERQYPLTEMVSSWAGAFGQTQFTPTTFFKYAADGDGDGRIDLWRSAPDALASSAALLKAQGWQPGQGWSTEVRLPRDFRYEDADGDNFRPVADWRARGVTLWDGTALPGDGDAAIYLPAGGRGPAFLLMPNFRVILKYNNAAPYALAVGLLAGRMAGGQAVHHTWPRDERPLSRDERLRLQTELTALGFDSGAPDGILGRKTRAALRAWQHARGIAADGFATADMLAMVDKDISH
jgi:membrane-bound lytic murein transglycosylase B